MPHVLADDFAKIRDRFPGDKPFGEDVTYDPVFESLKAEIEKLGAGGSSDGIDWKGVTRNCVEILSGKSKNLNAACYLTLALFNQHGWAGLADGLEIVTKLLQEDWDGLYPSRPKPRINAVQWLSEKLDLYAAARPPQIAEAEVLPPIVDQLGKLREVAALRLQHEAPAFTELRSVLSSALRPSAPAAETAPGAPAASPASAAPAATASVTAAPEAIAPNTPANEIADHVRALVPALRQADPFSPVPYRLLRSLKWDPVTAPPVLDTRSPNPGATRIPPPIQRKAQLEGLYAAGNWAELLQVSEGAFQEDAGTFWLDLHWYAATALERLDPQAGARAAEAVREEVARFVKRLEKVPDLYFADRTVENPKTKEKTVERTPFASEATRQWLETLRGDGGEPAPVFLPAVRSTGPEAPALSPEDQRKVQELLGKQQLGAAFDLLQATVEKAPNLRVRFRTRLAAARLCFQAQQTAWARALLEELLSESEAFSFEGWEPETAADLYHLLALCYSRPARKGGPQDADAARVQIENLRRRLCRLDLRAAASLEEALRR